MQKCFSNRGHDVRIVIKWTMISLEIKDGYIFPCEQVCSDISYCFRPLSKVLKSIFSSLEKLRIFSRNLLYFRAPIFQNPVQWNQVLNAWFWVTVRSKHRLLTCKEDRSCFFFTAFSRYKPSGFLLNVGVNSYQWDWNIYISWSCFFPPKADGVPFVGRKWALSLVHESSRGHSEKKTLQPLWAVVLV